MSNDTQVKQEAPPDISGNDSARLQGFVRITSIEIKAVGGVGAATSLEMIGYIRELEHRLATVRREEREAAGQIAFAEAIRQGISAERAIAIKSKIEASASEKGEMNG